MPSRKQWKREERRWNKLRRRIKERVMQEIAEGIKLRRQRILDIGDDEWEAADGPP